MDAARKGGLRGNVQACTVFSFSQPSSRGRPLRGEAQRRPQSRLCPEIQDQLSNLPCGVSQVERIRRPSRQRLPVPAGRSGDGQAGKTSLGAEAYKKYFRKPSGLRHRLFQPDQRAHDQPVNIQSDQVPKTEFEFPHELEVFWADTVGERFSYLARSRSTRENSSSMASSSMTPPRLPRPHRRIDPQPEEFTRAAD